MDSSPFSKLPVEARELIWAEVISGSTFTYPNIPVPQVHQTTPPGYDLLLTCKQIREEAIPVFYKTNAFAIAAPTRPSSTIITVRTLQRSLPPNLFAHVRHIKLLVTAADAKERFRSHYEQLINVVVNIFNAHHPNIVWTLEITDFPARAPFTMPITIAGIPTLDMYREIILQVARYQAFAAANGLGTGPGSWQDPFTSQVRNVRDQMRRACILAGIPVP